MVQPLEYYPNVDNKKPNLRTVFPTYVFDIKKTKASLNASVTYSGLGKAKMHMLKKYVQQNLKGQARIEMAKKTLILNITRPGQFQDAQKSILKTMTSLNEEFQYLNLNGAMSYLNAIKNETELKKTNNEVIVDQSAIVYNEDNLRRAYKRKGSYCDDKCEALELMIEDCKGVDIFPDGIDEDSFENLLEEAGHYYHRCQAFIQEAEEIINPFTELKDLIRAYRDAERSVRISRLIYSYLIEKPEPFSDMVGYLINDYAKSLAIRSYCAESLFDKKENVSASKRFVSRTTKELEKLDLILDQTKKEERMVSKGNICVASYGEDKEEEDQEYESYELEETSKDLKMLLTSIKKREKNLQRKLKKPKQKKTELELKEIPVFERRNYIMPKAQFEREYEDFVEIMSKIKISEDYLGLKINSFIF